MKRLFAAIPLAIAIGGCSVLPPTRDQSTFLVLTPISGAGADEAPPDGSAAGPALAIGLGPVQLPRYLDRLEVVTRSSQNTLELSPSDRWAEPLADNFRHVLAANLMTLLGTNQIVQYPWFADAKLDYAIRVHIDRFEPNAGDGAQLAAHWTIADAKGGAALISRETDANAPLSSHDSQAVAAGLSADLGDLARQIAQAVRQLRAAQPVRHARLARIDPGLARRLPL
jgi:uncharacterized lipoprotein YmbA